VKVVLSGEGGDEIFGGYGRYRSAMRPWWMGGKAMRAHGAFDRLDVLRAPPRFWRDGIEAAAAAAATPGRTRLQAAQALDVADWLPNDLLTKLDRCLMAHAVEGRTPFLDSGVAAAAFRLPDAMKVRDGQGKWVLRQWLAQHFPASEPFRRKQGFTVPVGAWIAEAADKLAPLVAAQPGVAEIAKPDRILPLFRAAGGKREGFAAWHLLFHALWHKRHVEGVAAQGDVLAYLAER
jgi:asparagine synthase (glutamine-hydrolysing)